ncbi:hypothetical protein [Lacipirellula sp.]|uniref:hypothetical protein n=1 Tax=Lacipirellula sp. TaxID=2691419 RepID=UPI003D120000
MLSDDAAIASFVSRKLKRTISLNFPGGSAVIGGVKQNLTVGQWRTIDEYFAGDRYACGTSIAATCQACSHEECATQSKKRLQRFHESFQ